MKDSLEIDRGRREPSSVSEVGTEPGLARAADTRQLQQGHTATVRIDALHAFRELVTALNGDPVALLRRAQLDPALLENEGATIPYSQMVQLYERAANDLTCADFGMRLAAVRAAHGSARFLGPLAVAMRNSPTLGEAFRYCAAHLHAYGSAAQITFEKLTQDARVFMKFEIMLVGLMEQRQTVEHALALTQHAIRSISGGRARACEVWFTHEPLATQRVYRSCFDAVVRFGQRMNGLFFGAHDFHLAVPDTDPTLYKSATTLIDDRFPVSAVSLSTRVRIIIARLLAQGHCTHEHAAAALSLHPRTLQRRLREEGKSFEGIKDAVRREVALRYLEQPDVSLVRVTEILGYSETSVLSRSCHRWFCASPRELRNGLNR